jgi:hypothetical protein
MLFTINTPFKVKFSGTTDFCLMRPKDDIRGEAPNFRVIHMAVSITIITRYLQVVVEGNFLSFEFSGQLASPLYFLRR